MARVYGKLMTSIWTDDDFRALSGAAQRLYMLLLASPKMNSAGVLPLSPSRWVGLARDATLEGTRRALSELLDRGYVVTDEATEEVWIRSFIRHDKAYRNSKMLTGLKATVESGIESTALKALARAELTKCLVEGPSMPDAEDGEGPSMPYPPTTPTTTPETEAAAATHAVHPSESPAVLAAIEMLLLEKSSGAGDPPAYIATLRKSYPGEVMPRMLDHLATHPDADADELVNVVMGRYATKPTPASLAAAGRAFGVAVALQHQADGLPMDVDGITYDAKFNSHDEAYITAAVQAYTACFKEVAA